MLPAMWTLDPWKAGLVPLFKSKDAFEALKGCLIARNGFGCMKEAFREGIVPLEVRSRCEASVAIGRLHCILIEGEFGVMVVGNECDGEENVFVERSETWISGVYLKLEGEHAGSNIFFGVCKDDASVWRDADGEEGEIGNGDELHAIVEFGDFVGIAWFVEKGFAHAAKENVVILEVKFLKFGENAS